MSGPATSKIPLRRTARSGVWEEESIAAREEAAGEVLVLPRVFICKIGEGGLLSGFLVLHELVAPVVVVHDIKDVCSVGLGHSAVPTQNHKVFIVGVGCLEAQVMAAGDDTAVLPEWIDDDNLVMDYSMSELGKFLLPEREMVWDTADASDQAIGLGEDRVVVDPGRKFPG